MIARAILRFLARTPWSTGMAVIGMALGVTSIVSVHLVSASVSDRLDELIPAELAGYSHFLHRENLTATDYFNLRRQWRAGELPSIQRLSPLIDETTNLQGQTVRVIGVDLFDQQPAETNERYERPNTDNFSWTGIWIDPSLENKLSLPVNGTIDAPAGTVLADIGPAIDLLDWPQDRLSYIGLSLIDPLSSIKVIAENLLPGFGAGFPTSLPALDLQPEWQLTGIAGQYPAREFGKSVLFNISALGLLALLVAWLLIYQVAVSWLRRLWPVFDRLHVLGVDWRQLRFYFLLAIGLLASVAAVLGIAGGWLLASVLVAMTNPAAPVDLSLDGWTMTKGVSSALGVCLVGGSWAFRQSQRGLQQTRWPFVATLVLLLAAGWCLVDERSGLAGGFFAIAVLSLASSQTIAPMLARFKRSASMIRGPYLLRIGIREALWHPGELSVALAGLALSIATAIGVALMVDSFRADFSQMLDHRLKYDVIARGDIPALGEIAQDKSVAANAERVQIYQQANIRVNGLTMELNVSRADAFEATRYGYDQPLKSHEVLLSEQAAETLGLNAGDEVEVYGHELQVAALFAAFGDVQPRLVVDQANPLAVDNRTDLKIESIAMLHSHPENLIATLRARFPTLELRQQTDIRRVALDTFDQTFAITTVLITIALMVASISVYIAVTTMRLNRQAGEKLLTTLGISRREKFLMDLSLGAGLGLIAIIIALPLGGLFGWILCHVINPRAFGWNIELKWSMAAILTPCLWGFLAALAAGVAQGGRSEEGEAGAR